MPEENDIKVDSKGGGLFLVDPNPSGRNVLPLEDMFIYVKLTAQERGRGVAVIGAEANSELENKRFDKGGKHYTLLNF